MHGTMRRRTGAILAAAVAGASLVAGVGVAEAHTHRFVSTNEIRSSGPSGVGGHVESVNPKCLRRTIHLYKMSDGEAHLYASKKSNENGGYRFPGAIASGRFYTSATRKHVVINGDHHHVCVPAESSKFLVGDPG